MNYNLLSVHYMFVTLSKICISFIVIEKKNYNNNKLQIFHQLLTKLQYDILCQTTKLGLLRSHIILHYNFPHVQTV